MNIPREQRRPFRLTKTGATLVYIIFRFMFLCVGNEMTGQMVRALTSEPFVS